MRARARAGRLAALAGLVALAALGPGLRLPGRLASVGLARAEDAWRTEFDAICGRTQDAMGLSSDELKALVARADALKPALARLDATRRKVFEHRLEACRNLYQFVLETRQAGSGR